MALYIRRVQITTTQLQVWTHHPPPKTFAFMEKDGKCLHHAKVSELTQTVEDFREATDAEAALFNSMSASD